MTYQTAKRINAAAARIGKLPVDMKGEQARDAAYVRNSTALDEGALMRRVASHAKRS